MRGLLDRVVKISLSCLRTCEVGLTSQLSTVHDWTPWLIFTVICYPMQLLARLFTVPQGVLQTQDDRGTAG